MTPVLVTILIVAVLVLLTRPQHTADPIVITIAREEDVSAPGGCIPPILVAVVVLVLLALLGA